jgi:hypothetical protein
MTPLNVSRVDEKLLNCCRIGIVNRGGDICFKSIYLVRGNDRINGVSTCFRLQYYKYTDVELMQYTDFYQVKVA